MSTIKQDQDKEIIATDVAQEVVAEEVTNDQLGEANGGGAWVSIGHDSKGNNISGGISVSF